MFAKGFMMKHLITLAMGIAVTLPALAALIPPQQSAAPERIRVRLAEHASQVTIRGLDLKIFETRVVGLTGPANALRKITRSELVLAPQASSEWEFRCQDSRVRAIPAQGGRTLTLKSPVVLSSPAGMIRFRGRPYRDELKIHAVGSLCEVVNELDIEKYLNGLVNAEFNSQWNSEAVQAQVIAARTYAIYQIQQMREKGPSQRFDVDASTRDQVYDGYVSEDYRGSQAVEKTRGMVLMAKNAQGRLEPIKAFYSSSCAGQTQLPEDVWGNHFAGFNHRVNCPYCANSSKLGWTLKLSLRDVAEAIRSSVRVSGPQPGWAKGAGRIVNEGQLVGIRAGSRTLSYRMQSVVLLWSYLGRVQPLVVSGVKLREWIGPARLKSTAFEVNLDQSTGGFVFSGRGNGHGVGMCQLGAKFLGERGLKTASILKYYYPDALLSKVW